MPSWVVAGALAYLVAGRWGLGAVAVAASYRTAYLIGRASVRLDDVEAELERDLELERFAADVAPNQ